jgi:hypothetical protein
MHAPEVDEHKVQGSAQAQLFARQRLALKQHEQRHPPKRTALVLHVSNMKSAQASVLRRHLQMIAAMRSKPGGHAAADMFAYHSAAQGWGEPLALVGALHLAPHAQLQAVRLVEAAGHLLHAAQELVILHFLGDCTCGIVQQHNNDAPSLLMSTAPVTRFSSLAVLLTAMHTAAEELRPFLKGSVVL